MRKKNRKHVVLIMFGLLIAIILMNYFGIFNNFSSKSLSIVPILNYPIETLSPYTCPLDVYSCQVSSMFECKNQQTAPKVVFRTNGEWVAADIDGTGLRCFGNKETSTTCGGTCTPSDTSFFIPSDQPFFPSTLFYANTAESYSLIVNSAGGGCCKVNRFNAGNNICNLAPSPLGSQFTEKVQGSQNLFYCPGNFETRDASGTIKYSEQNYVYSSDVAGNKTSAIKTIYPGWKAYSSGGDVNHLYYGTYQNVEDCTSNVCNLEGTGFYNCLNGVLDRNNLTYCDSDNGFSCQSGTCSFAFATKEILFVDQYGTAKPAFNTVELIKIKSKLISQFPQNLPSGRVDFQIFSASDPYNPISTIAKEDYSFVNPVYVFTTIDNPTIIGQYFVKVFVTPPGGNAIPIGTYNFRIAQQLTSSVNIRGADIAKPLFINSPVWIEVNVIDPSGTAGPSTEVDGILINGTFKGSSFYIDPNSYEKPPIISGASLTYKFITQFDIPGQLSVSAQVVKDEAVSRLTSMSKQIVSIAILNEFTNLARFSCIPKGTQELTIEVKNSLGDLVDATNTLVVTDALGHDTDISSTLQHVSLGEYKFIYNFQEFGGYSFSLTSFSSEYNLGSLPITGTIEVRDGCTLAECSRNTDCTSYGIDYVCNSSGKCVPNSPNWMVYLLYGIGILVVLVIIVFVVKFMKKKSKVVATGLEGL